VDNSKKLNVTAWILLRLFIYTKYRSTMNYGIFFSNR